MRLEPLGQLADWINISFRLKKRIFSNHFFIGQRLIFEKSRLFLYLGFFLSLLEIDYSISKFTD